LSSKLDSFEVFPWNDNFSIGIKEIDLQHRHLVDLLNELTVTLIQDDETELTKVFEELAAYADYHFKAEEALWQEYFPVDDKWYKEHYETHASFLPQVVLIKEELAEHSLSEIIEKIVRFLINWLASHIIDSDRLMASVVRYIQMGKSLSEAKHTAQKEMSGATGALIEAILKMYDGLSSRTLDLLRERLERIKTEKELKEAYRKLKEIAVTDQLTGLFNRHHFDTVFTREFRRAMREKQVLTFLMFDIDHFKKLNDRYGHIGGDVALKKTGELLRRLYRRPSDFVFRLGGEEFGILIAAQSKEDAKQFAELLRTEVEAMQILNVDSDVADHMTISVGLISKIPEENENPDLFMRVADDRLYIAKKQGRNRIVVEG
jgi:diguanylate cyclase (GGDEF)-like protein/hemerythrin-like metal-binding protein